MPELGVQLLTRVKLIHAKRASVTEGGPPLNSPSFCAVAGQSTPWWRSRSA